MAVVAKANLACGRFLVRTELVDVGRLVGRNNVLNLSMITSSLVVHLVPHLHLGPARVALVGGVVGVHVLAIGLLHLVLGWLLLLSQLGVATRGIV